ncbi:Solute carrier family 23 member 2, partial [Exaiptasia diaphana]
ENENVKDDKKKSKARRKALGLAYTIDENPPWYICLTLGFQHYLMMIGGTISIPMILSGPMCFADKPLVIAEVLNTVLFCSGIVTLLQTTFGVRLPILQGGTFAFMAPTFAILSLPKFQCPVSGITNSTNNVSSTPHDDGEIWKIRMREIDR